MAIRVKDGLFVFVNEMPVVEFWIAPPVQFAVLLHVPPFPVTIRG